MEHLWKITTFYGLKQMSTNMLEIDKKIDI